MGVLESPGKVLDFFVSKRVGTVILTLVTFLSLSETETSTV